MAKEGRKVLAVNVTTGERKEYGSAYALSLELGVTQRSIMQALERGGTCSGWRVYDTPENIRKQIKALEERLKVVESL